VESVGAYEALTVEGAARAFASSYTLANLERIFLGWRLHSLACISKDTCMDTCLGKKLLYLRFHVSASLPLLCSSIPFPHICISIPSNYGFPTPIMMER
jgi:hypothetical protein